ncbi:hypothetical protein [Flavobacteriaceae bacterium 14752]|uniref:hypothetical protein n=1 Tax=Mesohalobacter salilacus TaxID=2491711 RepID=UPI000F634F12|nr:hypothetical protein EIG84_05795 [Flavobacteriaceae bacterium 14752]
MPLITNQILYLKYIDGKHVVSAQNKHYKEKIVGQGGISHLIDFVNTLNDKVYNVQQLQNLFANYTLQKVLKQNNIQLSRNRSLLNRFKRSLIGQGSGVCLGRIFYKSKNLFQ